MRLVASAAAALVAPGKGILDADEDAATIAVRLTAAGIPATRENRRACREMLITTPGLAEGISGVTCATRRCARMPPWAGRSLSPCMRWA